MRYYSGAGNTFFLIDHRKHFFALDKFPSSVSNKESMDVF